LLDRKGFHWEPEFVFLTIEPIKVWYASWSEIAGTNQEIEGAKYMARAHKTFRTADNPGKFLSASRAYSSPHGI